MIEIAIFTENLQSEKEIWKQNMVENIEIITSFKLFTKDCYRLAKIVYTYSTANNSRSTVNDRQ